MPPPLNTYEAPSKAPTSFYPPPPAPNNKPILTYHHHQDPCPLPLIAPASSTQPPMPPPYPPRPWPATSFSLLLFPSHYLCAPCPNITRSLTHGHLAPACGARACCVINRIGELCGGWCRLAFWQRSSRAARKARLAQHFHPSSAVSQLENPRWLPSCFALLSPAPTQKAGATAGCRRGHTPRCCGGHAPL